MTTPPPSETGPSAEERTGLDLAATAEEIAAIFVTSGLPRTAAALLIVGPLERFGKRMARSAHLEDARAGCDYCASGNVQIGAIPIRRKDGTGWWHVYGNRGTFLPCARPEVWDALSLLPAKDPAILARKDER